MMFKDITGVQHNNLTVLRFDRMENKRSYWLCRCICGTEKIVRQDTLKNNKIFSCGCYGKEARRKKTAKPYGVAATNKLFITYKIHAKDRNLDFQIDLDLFVELTSSDCYYCGDKPQAISANQNNTGSYTYNGIDRVDNKQGYVTGNVVACCKACNYAKHVNSAEDYIARCIRIAERHKL